MLSISSICARMVIGLSELKTWWFVNHSHDFIQYAGFCLEKDCSDVNFASENEKNKFPNNKQEVAPDTNLGYFIMKTTIISAMFALICFFSLVSQENTNCTGQDEQTSCLSTCTSCEELNTFTAEMEKPSVGIDGDWIAVSVNVSKCRGFAGSLCSCTTYKGYKRAGLDQYKGKCTNYAGGHQCGHGPAAHGLKEY